MPAAQHEVGRDLVESYADSALISALSALGSLGLGVAMIAAAVALRAAYRLGWIPLALMLVALPLVAIHEPPFGPVGLAIFIAAVLLFVRQQASAPARSRAPRARRYRWSARTASCRETARSRSRTRASGASVASRVT